MWEVVPMRARIRLPLMLAAASLAVGGLVSATPVAASSTVLGEVTWTAGNGHTYVAVEFDGPDWDSAASDVSSALPGYHLATITSPEEQGFVSGFVAGLDPPGTWWIGGFQDPADEPDAALGWAWVTGETWGYTQWAPGQPDDGGVPATEQHVGLTTSGLWEDAGSSATDARGYIAESVLAPCEIHYDCPQGEFCYKGKCLRDPAQAVYHCGKPGCPPGHWCLSAENQKERCPEDPTYWCETASDCGPGHCCKGNMCVLDTWDPWLNDLPSCDMGSADPDADCGPGDFCLEGRCVPESTPCERGVDATYACAAPSCYAGHAAYGPDWIAGFRCHDPSTGEARDACGGRSCYSVGDCEPGQACVDTRLTGGFSPPGSFCNPEGGFCVSNAHAEAIYGYSASDLLPACDAGCTPGQACVDGWRPGGAFAFEQVVASCGFVHSCGDGICDTTELGPEGCPDDCGTCGNLECEGLETPKWCPSDCPVVCGDGSCTASVEADSCPEDCGCADSGLYLDTPIRCGDGLCQSFGLIPEDCGNCACDCGACPVADAGGPYEADEGAPVLLDGSGSSGPGGDLEYGWDLDDDGEFDDAAGVSVAWSPDDGPGSYPIALRVTGPNGASDTDGTTVEAHNVAPTATFDAPDAVDEGSDIALALVDPVDPSEADTAAGFQHAFDCGAGTGFGAWQGAPATSCSTDDEGPRTVAGRIRDKDGGQSEYGAMVTVDNVPPAIGPLDFDGTAVALGNAVVGSAGFADPGTADTHSALWDWGDGSTTPGTVMQGAGLGSVSDGHLYGEPGVYRVTLTVTDDDGGIDTETFEYIVVYDAAGGFVTGSGWIDSPEGAYAPDPSLTGRATFGFVSRYKKGAATPIGSTEFQFHSPGLNFHSTAYDWLVVTGSDFAKFKGEGTVDGAEAPGGGPYAFQIWAGGGEPNTFRIKIWLKDGEIVVYDNGMNQAIGGGRIAIHE